MKKVLLSILLIFSFCILHSQNLSQTTSTAWGNYVNTNIPAYGSTLLQVTVTGQNALWHGTILVQSTNSWTPSIWWNNARLISLATYNTSADDVQVLIMSANTSTQFGTTFIVVKTQTPVSGTASITVVATGQNASSLSLSNSISLPMPYTMTSSSGTYNTWTVNGNVGVGTIDPKALLDVGGELRMGKINSFPGEGSIGEGNWGNYIIGDNNTAQKLRLGVSNDMYTRAEIFLDNSNRQDGTISFKTTAGNGGAITRMFIDGNGTVGIGTTSINSDYKLFVEKGIRTRKVKVDQASWPDYVFHSTYNLASLKDLENYIKQNNHLPDVPSAGEVQRNGIDLGDNQATLLKKIEELTLYIIQQDKRIDIQGKQIESQQKQLEELLELKKDFQVIKDKLKTN